MKMLRMQTHFRSHSFSTASDAAGLLRLDRLALWQVMRSVLFVFSVMGQSGFLHKQAGQMSSE